MKPIFPFSLISFSFAALIGIATSDCGGRAATDQSGAQPPTEKQRPAEAGAPPVVSDIATQTDTEWLAILIDGHKSGYIKSSRSVFSDRVETEIVTSMEMRRGRETTKIVTVSKTTETPEGTPIGFEKKTSGVGMHQQITGTITADGMLRITTESAGTISSRTVIWPKGALMNEGQRREALKYGLSEGTTYTSTYFDPDLLDAIEVKVRVGGPKDLNLLGRVVEATEVSLNMKIRDSWTELTMFVDDEMNTLMTKTERMGLSIEMIACEEPYALSENDPLEVIRATFIASPRKLSRQERDTPLTYEVRISGKHHPTIVSTDEQSVTSKDDTLLISIARQKPLSGDSIPYKGEHPDAVAALSSTPWLQSDAPEIKKLAQSAVAGATDALVAAHNIERFVADYIDQKTLSVGYASALEAARSRQGDCTEHALLAAALCRAVGIPAQVVFGLAYVDVFEEREALFGGHAWTRVFVSGKWQSIDAAMGGFDTGHIALTISDGDPAAFFNIVDIIGNLEMVSIQKK